MKKEKFLNLAKFSFSILLVMLLLSGNSHARVIDSFFAWNYVDAFANPPILDLVDITYVGEKGIVKQAIPAFDGFTGMPDFPGLTTPTGLGGFSTRYIDKTFPIDWVPKDTVTPWGQYPFPTIGITDFKVKVPGIGDFSATFSSTIGYYVVGLIPPTTDLDSNIEFGSSLPIPQGGIYSKQSSNILNPTRLAIVTSAPIGLEFLVGTAYGDFIFSAAATNRIFMFPLKNPSKCSGQNCTPYNAEISSIMDHATETGIVRAFDGEEGNIIYGSNTAPSGYQNENYTDFFIGTLNYVGDGSGKTYLNYDGHPGYDYPCVLGADEIIAAAGGKVTYLVDGENGAANGISITHDNGLVSYYLHAQKRIAANGSIVEAGKVIAICGSEGASSTGPHLHFTVKNNTGGRVDPYGTRNRFDPRDLWSMARTTASVHSPIELHIYDTAGNHLGPNVLGGLDIEIPGANYYIVGEEKYASMPSGPTYKMVLKGTGSGTFTFRVKELDINSAVLNAVNYVDLPVSTSTTAVTTVTQVNSSISSLLLDANGDGNIAVVAPAPTPVARAGISQTVMEGTLTQLDGSGSQGSTGAGLSFLWTQTSGSTVVLSNPSASKPTFVAPQVNRFGQRLTFRLTVTDSNGAFATDNVLVAIINTPGDFDNDGDVDQNDLNILLADRGKTVSASICGAACDLDGDGMITALDARKLTTLCTRPRCATQ